jgi:sugar/nucleoside kinase (ribokinase family)
LTGTRVPDYVAIGHLTIDRTPVGDMLGGTVLYAALVAARFGLRAAVLTSADVAGFDGSLRAQLDRLAAEVEIVAQQAPATTTFTNREQAGRRSQTLHAWGEQIDLNGLPPLWRSAPAIHLAPVAQEIDPRQVGRLSPRYLGCTPQGWMREWDRVRLGPVRQVPLRLPADLLSRIDALVISSEEYVGARDVVAEIGRRGLAAVTRGAQGAELVDRGRSVEAPVFHVGVVDATGAGDVFAGALFAARSTREPVMASIRLAAAAAALKVGGRGIDAVPSRAAIESLIEQQYQPA